MTYWRVAGTEAVETTQVSAPNTRWSDTLQNLPSDGFERPAPDWELDLPADHGVHPAAQTETWQAALHLHTEDGAPLGLHLSIMRLGIIPPEARAPDQVWELGEAYRGHVTYLASDDTQAWGEERFARGLPGLTGHDPDTRTLRLEDWGITFDETSDGVQAIHVSLALQNDTSVALVMRPDKDVLALEPDGADIPFVGYILPRLTVQGTMERAGTETQISGTAWFEQSWGELPLPGAGPVAWDRLQFQLEDGTDASVMRSRRRDGRGSATVNAVVVDADARVATFDEDDVSLTSTRTWQHAETGADYPVAWRLSGPDFDIDIAPVADAQHHDFAVPMWSGLMSVTGRWQTREVSGLGHLYLTGYAP